MPKLMNTWVMGDMVTCPASTISTLQLQQQRLPWRCWHQMGMMETRATTAAV